MTDLPDSEVERRVSTMATLDARSAWKDASVHLDDEERTRAAFRQCILAARLTRRAADALPDGDERDRMIEDAGKIETAADDLKARLARIIEDGTDPGKAMTIADLQDVKAREP